MNPLDDLKLTCTHVRDHMRPGHAGLFLLAVALGMCAAAAAGAALVLRDLTSAALGGIAALVAWAIAMSVMRNPASLRTAKPPEETRFLRAVLLPGIAINAAGLLYGILTKNALVIVLAGALYALGYLLAVYVGRHARKAKG